MKGFNQFVAGVLIISFTISVALITHRWFVNVLRTQTRSLKGGVEAQAECSKGLINLISIDCSTDLLTLFVHNVGMIELKNITYSLKFDDYSYSGHCGFSLGKGEIGRCLALTRKASVLRKVRVSSSNCPNVYWENTLNKKCWENVVLALNFDEGSGTTAYDSSTYGNDGTLYNGSVVCADIDYCPKWVDGIIGKAISFDGIDDYVLGPFSLSWSVSTELNGYTFVAWVYLPKEEMSGWSTDELGKTAIYIPVIVLYDTINNKQTGLNIRYIDDNGDGIPDHAELAGRYKNVIAWLQNKDVSFNEWVQVVGIIEFTTNVFKMHMYVNGEYFGTAARGWTGIHTWGGNVDTWKIGIGRFVDDEVRIYNRALSEAEVKDLYNAFLKFAS